MVDKISVQIQLEGAAEIERQLAGVSQAGQKCFADIQNAAAQVGGFAKLDPTVVGAKFKQLGITATSEINKITAALKSSANLEATVLGVANLEQGFKKVGTAATAAFGLTRREIGALSRALRAVDLGPLGSQFALIGRVGGAFGPMGIAITAVGVAVAGAAAGMLKLASSATETEKALTQLQTVSGQSFETLSALSVVFAQGGTPVKQFASELADLSEQIDAAGQEARIRNASKSWVEWNNDISRVRRQFDNLAQGIPTVFNSLTTLDTKVQALKESLAKVAPEDRIFKLADIFKNLGSDLERAQIGKKLGLSPETIASYSRGSQALEEAAIKAQQLGLSLDEVDQKNLKTLRTSLSEASGALQALATTVGATIAPIVTAEINAATDGMLKLQATVKNFTWQTFTAGAIAAGDALKFLSPAGWVSKGIEWVGAWAATALGLKKQTDELTTSVENQANATDKARAASGSLGSEYGSLGGETNKLTNDFEQLQLAIAKAGRAAALAAGGRDPMTGQINIAGYDPANISGFASGGLLSGTGTGTSDSNLAWVSRGEYITPARAVAQPGVLAFLEALRRSGGNLSRVLDGMGHFALGGMVPRSMPAFASGGLAGGSNVTIQFPGLPAISGLRASSDVVDQLHKAAALAQVRSGGRKPSRYA